MRTAPEWRVERWFNAGGESGLSAWRGRVVLACAFQMLCPGCVQQAIPQLRRVRDTFPESDIVVAGLHTVFEHHEAMGPAALEAFLQEHRVRFPVAVDEPGEPGGVPRTMERYAMQGTPTFLLIDREGCLRLQRFGHLSDLELGACLGTLVAKS
mgnify:CR=1 FL=1